MISPTKRYQNHLHAVPGCGMASGRAGGPEDHRPVTLEALMVLGPQHSLPPMPSKEDPEVKEPRAQASA